MFYLSSFYNAKIVVIKRNYRSTSAGLGNMLRNSKIEFNKERYKKKKRNIFLREFLFDTFIQDKIAKDLMYRKKWNQNSDMLRLCIVCMREVHCSWLFFLLCEDLIFFSVNTKKTGYMMYGGRGGKKNKGGGAFVSFRIWMVSPSLSAFCLCRKDRE